MLKQESRIADVSDTASWVAHYRAVETGRPDALFHDPLAGRLAGDKGKQIAAAMPGTRYTGWSVVIRTCLIDGYIDEAIAAGTDTVLNLGAGLDTRPYRMALPPALRWIEVDHPHVIAYKNGTLQAEAPRCRLERVPLDLADHAARLRLFAEVAATSRRVLVLTEGVVPYLTPEQAGQLADDLLAQPRFGAWIVDYFDPRIGRYMQRRSMRRQMRNAPLRFFPDDWAGFYAAHGWTVRTLRYLSEESDRLGRRMPMPLWARIMVALSGRRGAQMRNVMGFAVLEPKA
jgi:methyltransferase (TIGR00027 family)